MKSIAVLCSDKNLNKKIEEMCARYNPLLEPEFLWDKNRIIEFLNYDLPEINVLNCTDEKIDVQEIIDIINNDPWLHYGGVIGLYNGGDTKELTEMLRRVNLIALIRIGELDQYFPRLLRILYQNRSILFQRDLHVLLRRNLSGEFILENDPFDLTTYSNLLANFLYNSNLIDHELKERFYVALMELLINAIEHGNCEIDYDEKTEYLESGGDILELIREKNRIPEIQSKKVYLNYRISPAESSFKVRDQGKGFDWKEYRTKLGEEGLELGHGRGIFMAEHYLGKLRFNRKGNEVSFRVKHCNHEGSIVPKISPAQEEIHLKKGEIVFTEGEKSTNLFYIVSGRYEIIAGDEKISILSPADIFLGEMSFLLNNQRSATVRAAGPGTLIKISKKEFINTIKEKPYYGLFLARLLSQRLIKLRSGTMYS